MKFRVKKFKIKELKGMNTIKQAFDMLFKGKIKEILERKVEKFGSGAHVIVPLKHRGKKAKIVIYD